MYDYIVRTQPFSFRGTSHHCQVGYYDGENGYTRKFRPKNPEDTAWRSREWRLAHDDVDPAIQEPGPRNSEERVYIQYQLNVNRDWCTCICSLTAR